MTSLSGKPSNPEANVPQTEAQTEHYRYLREVFSRFTSANLVNLSPEEFKARIDNMLGSFDYRQEGYSGSQIKYQRDLSIKFHWGHTHDFGDFRLEGRMRDRHIYLLADFCSYFSLSPQDFRDRCVLDVGCWTGGTTLLLLGLGANVVAIEEVKKYAGAAQFLVDSFGLGERGNVTDLSVYDLPKHDLFDRFHIVYMPGVVYHLSDPVLGLRHLYNTLKMGGGILVESAGFNSKGTECKFGGSRIHHTGSQGELNRGGWNWFLPSWGALKAMMVEAGFDNVRALYSRDRKRVYAIGYKIEQHDVCRAGLSVPDVT
jgi:SAM-dependent methyltransferase